MYRERDSLFVHAALSKAPRRDQRLVEDVTFLPEDIGQAVGRSRSYIAYDRLVRFS